jgi:hypothetical protein
VQPRDHDPDLGSLSDAALVRQTLPLTSYFGWKVVSIAVLVTLASGLWLGTQAGVAVFVASISLAVLAQRLRAKTPALQQARAAEHELGRRFGAVPLVQHLAEAREQLAADAELELLGLFRGRVLPHGGLRSMRLEVRAQAKLIVRTSPALSELQRGVVSTLSMVRRELPLTAAQVERLRTLLGELTSESFAPLASFVADGFPCEASVLQRDAVELHARANLAGLPEQLKHHPSVRLIELFLEFEAELVSDARLG